MDDYSIKEAVGEAFDMVEAELINIRQSSVRTVEGSHIELRQSGALSVDGERVEAAGSAVALIRGSDVYFNQGGSLVTACNNANIKSSFAPLVFSKDNAASDKSVVGLLGAREIKAENTSSLLMLANRVEGNVTTLLDWRSALALGAVIGGTMGLISLFKKR